MASTLQSKSTPGSESSSDDTKHGYTTVVTKPNQLSLHTTDYTYSKSLRGSI